MSDLDGYLPVIALIVAMVSLFAGGNPSPPAGPKRVTKLSILGGGIVLILIAWYLQRVLAPDWAEGAGAKAGGILGLVGALCAEWCSQMGKPSRMLPLAFAAFDLSIAQFMGAYGPLAYVFGAAAMAWLLSLKGEAPYATRTAIVSVGIMACDMLGQHFDTPVQHVGIYLALAAVIAGLIALPLGEALAKKTDALRLAKPLAFLVFFAGISLLLLRRFGLVDSLAAVISGAVLVGLVVDWFAEGEGELTRVIIGAILWIGVGTASFGYARSFGMSVALIAGICTALVLERPKAFLSLGPLASIVVYRLFWQLHPESAHAFDIGQHYALMGFLLGVLVPLLAAEWLRSRNGAGKSIWIAAILWILLIEAIPLPISIAFSDKGIVGYLVGLGVAPVLDSVRRRSLDTLYISIGLATAMVMLYHWIEPHIQLDRHDKIFALSWVGVLIAALGVAIALLSRPRQTIEAK